MKYDFESVIDRKQTGCLKWDHLSANCADDAIPSWVADMDFLCAPEITHAIRERARHEVFGYTKMDAKHYDAIKNWVGTRHGYEIETKWIIQSAGVVGSLNACVDELLGDGGAAVMNTPCYPPFFTAATGGTHEKMESPLVLKDGKYRMDLSDVERCFKQGAKVFILCNPHNPVGRAWSYDELYDLGALCEKYGVYVVSDDIHCDLMLPGEKYVPAMTVPTMRDRVITLISSTKTFNIAGLQTSSAIIPDESLLKAVHKRLMRYGHFEPNIFGVEAQYSGYVNCAGWVDKLMETVDKNMDYMIGQLKETPLTAQKPEATYLLWVDCRAMGLKGEEIFDFFIEKANICPTWGRTFGDENFIRLNLAAPRALVEEMGKRIVRAFG